MPTFGNLKSGKVFNFRIYQISPSRLYLVEKVKPEVAKIGIYYKRLGDLFCMWKKIFFAMPFHAF